MNGGPTALEHRFTFRPLAEDDLPLLREWLNRPHLQEWWREGEVSLDGLREKYLPRIAGADAARPFVALLDGEPAGYIQVYDASAGPEWWPDRPGPGVVGIDQFLADGERLGRGLGTAMVSAFVARLLEDPEVTEVRVDPRPDNLRAIRCYRKVGFREVGPITTPDGPALMMVLERAGPAVSIVPASAGDAPALTELAIREGGLAPPHSAQDHQAMNAALDPAVSRFTVLQRDQEAEAELWRGKVQAFRNLYGFLSQVIPYQDSDLERLYVFVRHLAAKLPRRRSGPAYQFDDEVRLEYYRLQKISEGSISLQEGKARALDGPTEVGSGAAREEDVPLSQLIDLVNERFGTDFNQADQLFFDQIVEAAVSDDGLRHAAAVNPEDKFELVFQNLLQRLFVVRMDQNEEIFVRYMNDPSFQHVVSAWMASEAYRRLRATQEKPAPTAGTSLPATLELVEGRPEERYVTCVPLVPLKAAASAFSNPQRIQDDDLEWIAVESRHRLRKGMFVSQVVGKSMEPAIPDGSYCLFRAPVEGTRQGKTVLVQLRNAIDPDTGERYTVKRYESDKTTHGDSWRHSRITLNPVSPYFEPIVLTGTAEGEFQVVAELVEMLGGESD